MREKKELFQSEVKIEDNADGVEADLRCIQGSDKVYGQREEEHPLAQIKEECLCACECARVFPVCRCFRMVEYTTHVVRVKGQRVRASLGVRPEGQTSVGHLMRSKNIDILLQTGQTQPTILLHTTKRGRWVVPRQANVVIS